MAYVDLSVPTAAFTQPYKEALKERGDSGASAHMRMRIRCEGSPAIGFSHSNPTTIACATSGASHRIHARRARPCATSARAVPSYLPQQQLELK